MDVGMVRMDSVVVDLGIDEGLVGRRARVGRLCCSKFNTEWAPTGIHLTAGWRDAHTTEPVKWFTLLTDPLGVDRMCSVAGKRAGTHVPIK